MAKRQSQLNDENGERFRQTEQQTRDEHKLKRPQAVRLYSTEMLLAQIMNIHNCGASRNYEWVQKYQHHGFTALRPQ